MKQRFEQQAGYVIHTRAFKETSLLVECFTHEYGRVSVVAKGAKRLKSAFRGVLQPFYPLKLSWLQTKSDLGTLILAECQTTEANGLFTNNRLACGLYLNELMYHLLAKGDPHPILFERYAECLHALYHAEQVDIFLRRFELQLLSEIGYALVLDDEANTQNPVEPQQTYIVDFDKGPVPISTTALPNDAMHYKGTILQAIQAQQFEVPEVLRAAKQLLRGAIRHRLGGKQIQSRYLVLAG